MKIRCALSTVAALFFIALITGCASEHASSKMAVQESAKSLHTRLETKKTAFEDNAPSEMVKVFNEGVREVGESEVLETALGKSDQVPDFVLPNA